MTTIQVDDGARLLVLCRHGESEGNQRGIFTGWLDLPLTPRGVDEAVRAGRGLRREGLTFGYAFTSALQRAGASCALMLKESGTPHPVVAASAALNERDYGELSGMDKDEARSRWGAAQVQQWRRSYDVAPPKGESLRDTGARVLPYYIHSVLPAAMRGGALVVAHGNSLRVLVMALDGLTPAAIEGVEIATSDLIVYRLDENAAVVSKRAVAGPPLGLTQKGYP